MNPELRKRFIDSIEYLRKMDFFKDYSSLSSEEILEKIVKLDRVEEYAEKRDSAIDYELVCFDTKRIFKTPNTIQELGEKRDAGITLLKKLAEISRGVFQPTDMKQSEQRYATKWRRGGYLTVSFKFRGGLHEVKFEYSETMNVRYTPISHDSVKSAVKQINGLIEDTGYQYYGLNDPKSGIPSVFLVLREEEAERLRRERGWELSCMRPRIIPELRKKFIDSIEYLRKMGFFQDYSSLSSEEILDKILNGEIGYETQWFVEEWPEEERRRESLGLLLKESLEENEEYWIRVSNYHIDLKIAFFDIKRVFVEDPETIVRKGMGIALMRKLARISRGVFNPTDMRESWSEWEGKPPPEAEGYFYRSYGCWSKCNVLFEFRGEKYAVDFYCKGDWLLADLAVKKINELIKDTGYQYYEPREEYIVYIVFSEDEAEKLKRERGWEFISLK